MRMRTVLGMMMIGGVAAYFHKRRGGEWTMASIKESAQEWLRSLNLDKFLGENVEQGRSRNLSDEGGSRRGSRNDAGEHGFRENRNGSGGMGSGSGGSGGMGRH